jgi:hypothetical protein
MREAVIAFCTPDLNRPMARRAIEAVKATDLRRAELMILDNAYDAHFHHPTVMQEMLVYASGRPVIFMDDDAIVKQADWIDRLFETATQARAAVVGCVHTSPAGEINHIGILVHSDGTTTQARHAARAGQPFVYTPSLSSAVMLVKNDRGLGFDLQYEKYHHDTDLGVAAWNQGEKVACALDLKVMHVQADYASRVSNVGELFARDLARFRQKWQSYIASGLYECEELASWKPLADAPNWDVVYNEASRAKSTDADSARRQFRSLIERCPNTWHRAGAYYHLYTLDGRREHLEKCLEEDPNHQKAASILQERDGRAIVNA